MNKLLTRKAALSSVILVSAVSASMFAYAAVETKSRGVFNKTAPLSVGPGHNNFVSSEAIGHPYGASDSYEQVDVTNGGATLPPALTPPEIQEPDEVVGGDLSVNCGCPKPLMTNGEEIAGSCVDLASQKRVFGSSIYNATYGSRLPAVSNAEMIATFDPETMLVKGLSVKSGTSVTEVDINSSGFVKSRFEFEPPVPGLANPTCTAFVRNPGRAFTRTFGGCIEVYPGSCNGSVGDSTTSYFYALPNLHTLTLDYLNDEYPPRDPDAYNGKGVSQFKLLSGFHSFLPNISVVSNRTPMLHGYWSGGTGAYTGGNEFQLTVELE